jgi:hypothetical protein
VCFAAACVKIRGCFCLTSPQTFHAGPLYIGVTRNHRVFDETFCTASGLEIMVHFADGQLQEPRRTWACF